MPANFSDKTWEETVMGLAEKIRSSKEMDPILKVSLLKRVLEYAGRGSYVLGLAVAEHQDKIKQSKLDLTVPWIDPKNGDARRLREDARQLISRLPPFEPALKAAKAHMQKLEDEI